MTDQVSSTPAKTCEKKPRGKPFQKGHDPRRNTKGAHKSFDDARALVQQLGNEIITSKDGSISMSRFQMIFKDWLSSGNFQKQKAAIELAFGKVPDKVELGGKDGGPVILHVIYDKKNNA